MSGKTNLLQYAATVTGSMTVVGYGAIIAWSSPAVPHLESANSEILITKDQSSWIASLSSLGFLIGFVLNPLFVDRFGRKWTLILFSLPQITSWLLIILAKSYITLYIARLVGGTGYGGGLCTLTIYFSEIGNKNNRGIFLVLIRLSMGIGMLFTTVLGAFLTYNQMNFILLMLPIIFLVLFLLMPDSSYFLEINKRLEEEEMRKINCVGLEEAETEETRLNFEKNPTFFKEDPENKSSYQQYLGLEIPKSEPEFSKSEPKSWKLGKNSFNFRESSLWKLIGNPKNRKALAIVIFLGFTVVFSGNSILGSFGQKILTHKGAIMDPKNGMVFLSLLNVFACLISTQIVERVKRRTLLLYSGIISSISLGIVGVFFCLDQNELAAFYFGWVPIFFLSVYDLLISAGLSNIFYIYQGELFTNDVKSAAVTVIKLVYIAIIFISILEFQKMIEIAGMNGIFWFYGICCVVGTVLVYFMAPETKGKALEEIQECLEVKRFFPGIQDLWRTKEKKVLI
ncbi:facilitated trehalose transporter Tret1-2 homolog [Belonocnema kinseyi]|uniref:facilitated trehalose transporter Tret1-2 homolog n=1 Tax=Belonocnema kinseyi TaxID=2817044 RepID=UPI00143CC36D|nr:facilitated trehalose transporter Tret1-2 homolog [Belonocnema kinseyi]